jgi:hypothetical protein
MTAALQLRDAHALSAESLKALMLKLGARVDIRDAVDEVVARWPVRTARVPHDERRVAVFRMNERGDWRGVLLVGGTTQNAYDLVAQEPQFRDVLHVALWLSRNEPKGRPAALSPVLH